MEKKKSTSIFGIPMRVIIIIGMFMIVATVIYDNLIRPSTEEILAGFEKAHISSIDTNYYADSVYYSAFGKFIVSTEAPYNTVKYETVVNDVQAVRERLENEMAPSEEVLRRLDATKTSRGGSVIIHMYASTYKGANTGNYRVVIMDKNNTEVYREDLKSRAADTWNSSGYGDRFWNLAIIHLKDVIQIPFKVYLINRLSNSRDEFIIDHV